MSDDAAESRPRIELLEELVIQQRKIISSFQREAVKTAGIEETLRQLVAGQDREIEQLRSMVANQTELIANLESLQRINQRFLEVDASWRREIADRNALIASLERELARAKEMLGFDPTKRGSA